MRHDGHAESIGGSFLPTLDLGVFELMDETAINADDVIVVFIVEISRFIPGLTVPEPALVSDASIDEELHRAVHRRVPDSSHTFLDLAEELVEVDMLTLTPCRKECLKDDLSLPCLLHAIVANVRGISFT